MAWSPADDAAPPLPLSGRSVLIVEDHYLFAEELRALVERLGARVLGPAWQVAAAIEILAAEKPALALLDVNLDEEEVYAVAIALGASGVPFVFATDCDAWIIAPASARPCISGSRSPGRPS